jgi:hypothetical protein
MDKEEKKAKAGFKRHQNKAKLVPSDDSHTWRRIVTTKKWTYQEDTECLVGYGYVPTYTRKPHS